MTDEASVRFRQIAVLGVRSNVRGAAVDANKRHLQRIGLYGGYQELLELAPDASEPYRVPPSGETTLSYRGLPYDCSKTCCALRRVDAGDAISRAARRCGHRAADHAAAWRHVGLLCTAGLLNGVFGQGDDAYRTLAIGQACDTFVEDDGDEQIIHHGNGGQ